jgi:hypothetical protein
MKHEVVQLAGKLDWEWLDGEIAPLYSDKGRPGIETRFVIGAATRLTTWRHQTSRPWPSHAARAMSRPLWMRRSFGSVGVLEAACR